jgi:hypothetical protein
VSDCAASDDAGSGTAGEADGAAGGAGEVGGGAGATIVDDAPGPAARAVPASADRDAVSSETAMRAVRDM